MSKQHQPYDKEFYDSFDESSLRSARIIVPHVMEWVRPDRVVDVGCGLGIWLSVFLEQGVSEVLGLDGDYVDRDRLFIPQNSFQAANLSNPEPVTGGFDLAVSLEVAEHIPARTANRFIDLLTGLAPRILFSAAVPGQVGTHHINLQWPDYWHELFAARGYKAYDPVRPLIWHNEEVSLHYRQNIFLYSKGDEEGIPAREANCLTLVDMDILRANEGLRASFRNIVRALKKRAQRG